MTGQADLGLVIASRCVGRGVEDFAARLPKGKVFKALESVEKGSDSRGNGCIVFPRPFRAATLQAF